MCVFLTDVHYASSQRKLCVKIKVNLRDSAECDRVGSHVSKISENKNVGAHVHTQTWNESFSHMINLADLLISVCLKIKDTADIG